jgi:protein-S-isoprenylcysteine O-methyltransferase Ste14
VLRDLSRRWRRWAAHNRVRVTMVLGLVYVAYSVPTLNGLLAGGTLLAAGQAIRFWAAGHLDKNIRLARGGPYRIVRHPLYLGSFLMGLGLAVAVEDPVVWAAVYLLLFLGFFVPAIHVEELRLQSIFGAEYQDLMVDVPGLVPRLWRRPSSPAAAGDQPRFSWNRVLGNYELRSAAAMAALIAVQVAKLFWG